MGGSRRKLKQGKPKVKVGVVKRNKLKKAQLPLQIKEGNADLQTRLNKQ